MNEATSVKREDIIKHHPELAAFAISETQYAIQSSTKLSEGHITTHNGEFCTGCGCKHGTTPNAKGVCWHAFRTNEELQYKFLKGVQTNARTLRQEDEALEGASALFNPDNVPLRGNLPFGLLKR